MTTFTVRITVKSEDGDPVDPAFEMSDLLRLPQADEWVEWEILPERKPPCGIEFEGPSCSIQNVRVER